MNIQELIPSERLFAQQLHGSKRYIAMLSLTRKRFSAFIVNEPLHISVYKFKFLKNISNMYTMRTDERITISEFEFF